MTIEPEDLTHVPQAGFVRVFYCLNPHCRRPHVVLSDDDGRPFAQFVVPDPRADGGFLHDLKSALYESAVERDAK